MPHRAPQPDPCPMADVPEDERAPVQDFTCPIAAGLIGTTVSGVIARDGTVASINPAVTVDEVFLETRVAFAPSKKRFRFAYRCTEAACPQWTGSACRMITRMIAEVPQEDRIKPDQCVIRPTCRWFAQAGWDACRVCPIVITDAQE